MVWLNCQQLTAADFFDIDSFIPLFNKWDANEHLRKLVEVDGEEGGRWVCDGEHVNFLWSIGIEEKASSFCVYSTVSAIHSHLPSQIATNWHLSEFKCDKRQLYQRLL